ncbi:MAG: hypothetical protein JWO50_32 [Candidatus Kaiserbacteria bacterium]|nr:hypothetical protein [Candidatus Kaiserbacteria bacterium]
MGKSTKSSSSMVFRSRVLCAFFILLALLIIARLYFVQIVHGESYAAQAQSQYVEQNSDQESRGTIFFTKRDGTLVAAAVMQSGWRIAINPSQILDAHAAYAAMNAVTPIDEGKFMDAASKKKDPYEEVAFRLDDATEAKIAALKLSGVILVHDQWRNYPGGNLASQILGFISYRGNTRVGMYGLERQYQNTLSISNNGLFINPFAEIFSNISDAVKVDPTDGKGSIITTIEPAVQTQLEKVLNNVMDQYTPDFDGGIVMDPHTGAIIAMAGMPSFDPNTFNTVDNPTVFQDKLVEGRYELGSIMKPLTMAAGIDSGAITTATTYNDTGCIIRSGKRVCDFDFVPRGVIPMQEILNQSLNLGATFVADTMGHPTQTKYVHAYGFGSTTGIDLPNEVMGDLSPLGNGNGPDVNYATASFGQGVSVSPIEMARALASLANGGVLPSPHVVSAVQYQSGIIRAVPIAPGVRVLATSSAETVTNMLIQVYDKALMKGTLKQEHYSIAAKTGTAQIPAKGGGYLPPGTYLHSFFGYFPAHDPKFIIFLFAFKPHGQEYASATLANPFLNMAQFLINYYNLPPDR